MKLFKHVDYELPKSHQIPALKHALGEAKAITTDGARKLEVKTYDRYPHTQTNIDNLESFEDE